MISANGKQKAMGYFATKLEAMAYQVDYNQSHGLHRLSDNKITFAELYTRWLPKHIEYSSVSDSTIHGYESAYKHCRLLYDLPVSDIKYSHLQTVIDGMNRLSYASNYVKPSKRFDTNLLLTKELPNLKSTTSIVCIVILFCC